MALGDLAREDEYGDPDPWTAAANAIQRKYLGRNVVGAPEAQQGQPPLWNPVGLSTVQRAANEQMAQLPMWRETQMRKPLEGLAHTAKTLAFPTDYARGATHDYPPGSEEAQFLEDSRNRSATDWGRKMAYNMVFDPVPAGVAALRGQPLRGTMGSVGAGAGQGIRAYHSSPHDFEKFDFSKIGTGEGAQVYGHGGYFAENPAVSGQGGEYWKQFLNRFKGAESTAATRLAEAGFDRGGVLDRIGLDIDRVNFYLSNPDRFPNSSVYREHMQDLIRQRDLIASGKPVGPRTYEVNIKAKPEELLDWDKRMHEQPLPAQELHRTITPDYPLEGETAESFYRTLKFGAPRGGFKGLGPEGASGVLREAGIPGVRYLDQGSRQHAIDLAYAEQMVRQNAGSGISKSSLWKNELGRDYGAWQEELARLKQTPVTSNYVMFPGTEHLIDITKKLAVPAGVAMGGLAAQDNYQDR